MVCVTNRKVVKFFGFAWGYQGVVGDSLAVIQSVMDWGVVMNLV